MIGVGVGVGARVAVGAGVGTGVGAGGRGVGALVGCGWLGAGDVVGAGAWVGGLVAPPPDVEPPEVEPPDVEPVPDVEPPEVEPPDVEPVPDVDPSVDPEGAGVRAGVGEACPLVIPEGRAVEGSPPSTSPPVDRSPTAPGRRRSASSGPNTPAIPLRTTARTRAATT